MVDSSSKVVSLSDRMSEGLKSMQPKGAHSGARYPAPLRDAIEKGKLCLRPLLQTLFDHTDDALFELADRAERNAEQNMYFESMRELRIKRRGMELNFYNALDERFRQLTRRDSGDAIPLLDNVNTNTLALVSNDELEELVAIDAIVARGNNRFARALADLTARWNALLESDHVSDNNNPFGPAVIAAIFTEGCANVELDIKAKLVLFKLFERHVIGSLDGVLNACNQTLVVAGVLKQGCRQPSKVSSPIKAASTPSPDVSATDVFSDLQNLLHQTPQPVVAGADSVIGGLVAAGLAPAMPRNTLLQLLQLVQQHQLTQLANLSLTETMDASVLAVDVRNALSSLVSTHSPGKQLSLGEIDDDAINLVAMLFQFILDDRNLAVPMKALISRLQIPIIKVAMADKSFFSKGGHPARKLLNEIATAALGWMPGNNLARDPLYKKVEKVVDQIVNDFDTNPQLFQDVLADFIGFLEVEKRRAGLVEQRTIDAEDGKARAELARAEVDAVLEEKRRGVTVPDVVGTLLSDGWSNVLFLHCLKGDQGKADMTRALQLVDDLIWSVGPMSADGSRQKLLRLLPGLLRELRAGLGLIGFNPHDMNQLLEELEAIHLRQLSGQGWETPVMQEGNTAAPVDAGDGIAAGAVEARLADLEAELSAEFGQLDDFLDDDPAGEPAVARKSGITPVPAVTAEPPQASVDEQLEAMRDQPRAVKSKVSGKSAVPAQVYLDKVDTLKMGNWMEILQDDGKKYRCRLAAVIRGTGKYIFVNRSGMKVAEHNRETLALAIQHGEIKVLDEGLLFDRALESVIGNLRDMKGS